MGRDQLQSSGRPSTSDHGRNHRQHRPLQKEKTLTTNNSRIVGFDLGGSKTHAVAMPLPRTSPPGTPLPGHASPHEVLAGSANLSSVGAAEAERQLVSVFDGLDRDGIVAVCAGAAGVDTPEQEDRLHTLIQAQVPDAVVRIVHDTHLILAAARVQDGIAVISGTGSVAWGRTADGLSARAGGWGYLLGDEGSGYWIAQQAVRHALAVVDRTDRPDRLAQQLAADCGLQDPGQLLDHFYAHPERRYWAGHARLVFELAGDGDPVSAAIIARAATSLVELVRVVGAQLDTTGPVVFGGGLILHQPQLQDLLRAGLVAAGFGEILVLHCDPVHGAVNLARNSWMDLSRPRPVGSAR